MTDFHFQRPIKFKFEQQIKLTNHIYWSKYEMYNFKTQLV